MDQLPNAAIIGLSATPWTEGLGKYFSSLVVGATASELIELGYLVDTTVFAPFTPSLKGIKIVAGDYQQKQLADRVNTKVLIGRLVEHWFKYGESRQTIAFAVNVAHSKHIARVFSEAGVSAAHIDGYMNSAAAKLERKETINRFKAGGIRMLSSVGVLSKGFDYPGAGCMIWARPTRSLMLAIQMLGRALRPFAGKTDAIIIDHAGNTVRHGFITDPLPYHLDDGTNEGGVRTLPNPPVECRSCGVLRTPGKPCKKCGYEPPNEVIHTHDTLVQIRQAKSTAIGEEQRFFSELLRIQIDEGYSDDWVQRCYEIRFGVSLRAEIPNHFLKYLPPGHPLLPRLEQKVADTVSQDTRQFIHNSCAGVRRRSLD